MVAGTLNLLGSLAVADGDYKRAYACLAEGLALQRELRDPEGALWSLFASARLRAALGEASLAVRLASAAMAVRDQVGVCFTPSDEDIVACWLAPAHQTLSEREAQDARAVGQALFARRSHSACADSR